MRIAFVYDWIDKFGGAERVLLALHEIWPEAPLFTAVYNKKKADWATVFKIKSSFLDKIPFSSKRHELFPTITPYVFESFNFDDFDVVLSITSSDSKAIITKPQTLHICYCLTPTRYLWSGYRDYLSEPGVGLLNPLARILMKTLLSSLRKWDYLSSNRPDKYIAISETVAQRIKNYYKKEAEVIYPPVDTNKFRPRSPSHGRSPSGHLPGANQDYFLIVSRLVPYKKIDYVIAAFNRLGWPLKIIGSGIDEGRLHKLAKSNIEFITANLTDEKLCCYYQNCKALIFPGEEDFGLTSVEAQACGKPVIGLGRGGVGETIIAGQTGEIYTTPDKESLISVLNKFNGKTYSSSVCRKNAMRFSKIRFQQKVKTTVFAYWQKFIT